MSKDNKRRLGQRLVAEFSGLRDALRTDASLEKRYTIRTVELDLRPKAFDAESVRIIRNSLSVSQAVFARLLGVSVDLVASWEQGNRTPAGPASRLLELMQKDTGPWLKILEESVSQKTSG